jgi:Uma2 family endonuclease
VARQLKRLVEFSHGYLEVLPMPTISHQTIAAALYQFVAAFVGARTLGTVLFAPLRVRLWPGKFREPDVVFMLAEHEARIREAYWEGADLAIEVVSEDGPAGTFAPGQDLGSRLLPGLRLDVAAVFGAR